ncbi:MAG TPA: lipid-A-disaccharide synthase [Thermoanaerobaculia bacterium]|nr:lipid-A-disaccharide synthase [Thermoanaerobaculia bacterium]
MKPTRSGDGAGRRTGLLVVAGEASGDLHGARLIAELERMVPDLECFGLGGDELQRHRFDSVAHSRDIAVVGFTEVLGVIAKARRIFRDLLEETERRRPAAALLIDSPGFNLRLARRLRKLGVPVVYYVSPQIWAWRQGRVKSIARRVCKMLVLFGFEVDFYRRHGVPVRHVGHPLVDEVPQLDHVLDEVEERRPRIALLPGSRQNEVKSLLGAMLRALEAVQRERPIEVVLLEAPTLPRALLDEMLAGTTLPIERVSQGRLAALARCHLALCASGTATLEVGLIGTPMIVLYRVSFFTSLLGRALLRVPHIGLVNLVLGREVAPELVQDDVNPERIRSVVERLLGDRAALVSMRRALQPLRERLGEGGASRRAAEEVAAVLRSVAGAEAA